MSQAIPSLERAIQAMNLLAGLERGVTPAELARLANLSRATAFRVLKTLQATGMAEKRSNLYLPGPLFMQMAARLLNHHGIRDAAIPVLRQLSDAAGQTSHLAVRAGDQAIILEVCDGPRLLRVASRAGTLIWMHCSSTGKAILAAMDESDAQATMERAGYPQLTDRTITEWDELRCELRRVRRKGYAIDDREYNEDVRCLAAPVFTSGGLVDAAVGVTGPAATLTLATLDRVGEEVALAARRLAERLSSTGAERSRFA